MKLKMDCDRAYSRPFFLYRLGSHDKCDAISITATRDIPPGHTRACVNDHKPQSEENTFGLPLIEATEYLKLDIGYALKGTDRSLPSFAHVSMASVARTCAFSEAS